MSRRHRANINVEELESKVVLSGITPATVIHHPALAAAVAHLDGSLKGTYVLTPGPSATSATPGIRLIGGGLVAPLGVVSLEGRLSSTGGILRLRATQTNFSETVVLSAPHAVGSSTESVETFFYVTTDGKFEGTFVLDVTSSPPIASAPSQQGTFTAQFS